MQTIQTHFMSWELVFEILSKNRILFTSVLSETISREALNMLQYAATEPLRNNPEAHQEMRNGNERKGK